MPSEIARCARLPGVRAFRYGGEEFCLLFGAGQKRNAREICENLRTEIADMRLPIRSRNSKQKSTTRTLIKLTISIGLAERGARLRSPPDMLIAADKALYKAKAAGRNRVVIL